MGKSKFYEPRILVLEGLYSDTMEIVAEAGGWATEVMAWDLKSVARELRTGEYDGIVLTGGSDIDPRLYGEKPHKTVYGVDQSRDIAEYYALEFALDEGIPVLGICRGSQIMTAFRGGSLVQNIGGHRGNQHPVYAEPGAKTFRRAINAREMDCVSLHHQCVKEPGKGMKIAARALDGTPEAVESDDGLWLGVQYHPEMAAYENANAFAIFKWLVKTAANNRGKRPLDIRFKDAVKDYRARKSSVTTYAFPAGVTAKAPVTESSETAMSLVKADRKAGDPALPSMREVAEKITAAEDDDPDELYVCPTCAILFDYKNDRDDHLTYVHGYGDDGMSYPELEPHAGHPAWDKA